MENLAEKKIPLETKEKNQKIQTLEDKERKVTKYLNQQLQNQKMMKIIQQKIQKNKKIAQFVCTITKRTKKRSEPHVRSNVFNVINMFISNVGMNIKMCNK